MSVTQRFRSLATVMIVTIAGMSTAFAQLEQKPADEYIAAMDKPDRVLKIDEVVAKLALKPGDMVADVGSGSGVYTIPFAKAVAPNGIVYAVDIDQKMIDFVLKRAKEAGLTNVKGVLGEYDDPKLPENPEAFGRLLAGPPASLGRTERLQYLTSGPLAEGLPPNHVALSATAEVDVPSGAYDLQVISDEGVRVWVDDRLVVDRWAPHESIVDRAPITRGKHKLRVEYYDLAGFAELKVDVVRRR